MLYFFGSICVDKVIVVVIQTRLFVTSAVPIFKIFADNASPSDSKAVTDHARVIMDDLASFRYWDS